LGTKGLRDQGLRDQGLGDSGVVKDGEEQAEDGLLGIVVGESFVEDFGVEAECGQTGGVDGTRERGRDDFKLVEADQFLTGALGEEGAGDGHGLEGSAEAFAAFEGGFGDAAEFAVVTGEETHDQIGLVHRPGAEDDGF